MNTTKHFVIAAGILCAAILSIAAAYIMFSLAPIEAIFASMAIAWAFSSFAFGWLAPGQSEVRAFVWTASIPNILVAILTSGITGFLGIGAMLMLSFIIGWWANMGHRWHGRWEDQKNEHQRMIVTKRLAGSASRRW